MSAWPAAVVGIALAWELHVGALLKYNYATPCCCRVSDDVAIKNVELHLNTTSDSRLAGAWWTKCNVDSVPGHRSHMIV